MRHTGDVMGHGFRLALLSMLIALTAGWAMSCTKGLSANDTTAGGTDGLPELKLTAVAPSPTSTVQNLDVAIVRAGGGFDVSILAGEKLPELRELFFSVDYPAATVHSLGLPGAPQVAGENVIGLVVEPRPGHIECGTVATVQSDLPAIRPGDPILTFRLVSGPSERSASEVASSARARARNLQLAKDGENWVLSWDYTNPGDANQDGEVGIGDLTPIGAHFLQQVNNSWDDPLRNIDGDSNGEINAGDITPIGQNYASEIFAYQIEMSEAGASNFRTIGQMLLEDERTNPGETVTFTYTFGSEYVEDAWYRVVTLDRELLFGIPSESISENGRRLDPVDVPSEGEVMVTLYANNLSGAMAHMNAVRVVFPDCYEYVRGSANPGAPGGYTSDVDGIWTSFVQPGGLLFPPDNFFVTTDLGDGKRALDLNVTTIDRIVAATPVGYGDLINFKLKNNGTAPLTLEFQAQTEDGVKRTYFSDDQNVDRYFGNSIGIRANQ